MAIGLAASALAGCATVLPHDAKPLLRQPKMPSGTVVLDVFLTRFPLGDPKCNGPAWREVDEQSLPADNRRHLLANGFRVGVLAGQLPDELAERLALADTKTLPGDVHTLKAAELAERPAVVRGHFQLRPRVRKEFSLGPSREELPVLLCDPSGSVLGQTYRDAQPLLAVRSHPLADGRIRLEVTPEIAYGQCMRRWDMDDQGVFHVESRRSSRVFENLKFDVVLSPGHTLVMSTAPSRPESVGGHFFSEPGGDQMLLLVRLSQTQHDGAFAGDTDSLIE